MRGEWGGSGEPHPAAPVFGASDWQLARRELAELEARSDWKGLERAHRALLAKLRSASTDELLDGVPRREQQRRLWRSLASIYRDRLADREGAVTALELVTSQWPDDTTARVELALLRAHGATEAPAPNELEESLVAHPESPDLLGRLFDGYFERPDHEAAWCTASALVWLGAATPRAQKYQAELATCGHWSPGAPLTHDEWESLRHPDEDRPLTELLDLVAPVLLPHAPRRPFIDPRALAWGAQRLGVPAELVERSAALRERSSGAQASLPGQPAALLFAVGWELARLRRPSYALAGSSVEALTVILIATMKLFAQPPVPGALAKQVEVVSETLFRGLSGPQLAQARRAASALLAAGGKTDVRRWRTAVNLGTMRVGLLLAGQLVGLEEPLWRAAEGLPAERVRADLAGFFAGRIHRGLRHKLGYVAAVAPRVRAAESEEMRATQKRYEEEEARWAPVLARFGVEHATFAGGQPRSLVIGAEALVRCWPDLVAAVPFDGLRVIRAKGYVGGIVRSARLSTLELLGLEDQGVTDEDLIALAASPYVGRLQHLELRFNPIGPRGIEALAASRTLTALRFVGLSGNPHDPRDIVIEHDRDHHEHRSSEAGLALEAKYGPIRWLRIG